MTIEELGSGESWSDPVEFQGQLGPQTYPQIVHNCPLTPDELALLEDVENRQEYQTFFNRVMQATTGQTHVERAAFDIYILARQLAEQDPLIPHMPNRRAFDRRIVEEFKRSIRANQHQPGAHNTIGVLMADLDNFKLANDKNGHGVGDELLRTVGKSFLENNRDFVARIGGDEFGLILPGASLEEALITAQRIQESTKRSTGDLMNAEEAHFHGPALGATVGIAIFDPQMHSSGELKFQLKDLAGQVLNRADQALNQVKDLALKQQGYLNRRLKERHSSKPESRIIMETDYSKEMVSRFPQPETPNRRRRVLGKKSLKQSNIGIWMEDWTHYYDINTQDPRQTLSNLIFLK